MNLPPEFTPSCPIPIAQYPHVLLAHGGGGRLMHDLIARMFAAAFANPILDQKHDSATLDPLTGRLAFTTDSYVVKPLFFPGGDIGSLAVYGTVNDLAMCGARPLHISAGFILEEGLSMDTLWQIVRSMSAAARRAGVQIVTGDTKVVERGKGDGVYINTSGIGRIEHERVIAPQSVQPGDAVIVSGDLGRHGIAVMAQREGLQFETTIVSDAAPLADIVLAMLESGIEIHCLRDCTRGGMAGSLIEIAETARVSMEINEADIRVGDAVAGACEILGFDPLYVANEGRFVAFVPAADSTRTLEIMHRFPTAQAAAIIGFVSAHRQPGLVTMRNRIGSTRIIDMPSGEQLPRIC